jgi:hypothetical protein
MICWLCLVSLAILCEDVVSWVLQHPPYLEPWATRIINVIFSMFLIRTVFRFKLDEDRELAPERARRTHPKARGAVRARGVPIYANLIDWTPPPLPFH